jgi:hypothetical protein
MVSLFLFLIEIYCHAERSEASIMRYACWRIDSSLRSE